MERKEISFIINHTILNFCKDVKKPLVEFLPKRRYSKLLSLMKAKKHLNMTPCFVASMIGGEIIYYCDEIINELTSKFSKEKKKLFVEAITLHELFHIWNNIEVKNKGDLIFSETLVFEEMREMYPEHSELLEKYHNHGNH